MHKFWGHLRNLRLEHLWNKRSASSGADNAVRASLKPPRLLALEDRLLFDASPIAGDDQQAEPISIERLVELFDDPSDIALTDLFSLTALPDAPDVNLSELQNIVHELTQFSASSSALESESSSTLSVFNSEILHKATASPDYSSLFLSTGHPIALPERLATNLIVLDSRVTGIDALLADLRAQQDRGRNLDILILDPTRNGIDQITEAINRLDRLNSLQIVSHGDATGIQLGGVWLDESQLAANAASFEQWQDALSDDADIVLYGCNLAGSEGGRELLSALAQATGADVAASDDLTGHASLGGDWDLEYRNGLIESGIAFTFDVQANWVGTLATVTVSNVTNVANGNTSSIGALILTDGGDGISLMEAIMAANSTGGADTINFNIAGAGPHTIIVNAALPTILEQVTFDGSSEPDWATNGNRPIVILDGNNLVADGLVLTASADGSTIRGLVIRDFRGDGIEIQANSNGNTIAGNYIGQLNTSGTDAGAGEANAGAGINVLGANNTIGGLTTADRNVLSGNTSHGILITGAGATGNTVAGNYVGLTASGSIALGNGIDGIAIVSASGNTIGGVTAMHQNVVAANADDGVQIQDGDNNIVEGNRIGTDNSGNVDLGNLDDGIAIESDSDNNQIIGNQISGNSSSGVDVGAAGLESSGNIFRGNLIGTAADGVTSLGNTLHGLWLGNGLTATGTIIGGTLLGQGNTIAWNGGDGVYLQSSTGVSILGNSIFSNTQQGIDVGTNGVTNNDLNDGDVGANNQQNFPVLQAAVVSNSQIMLSGTLNSESNKTYRIEFFANTANDIEGQRFLGFTTVTTPASTPYTTSFNVTLNATVAEGEYITATATDPSNNTSEFSATYRALGITGLWISGTNNSTAGGVSYDSNSVAQLSDPNLSFEPGTSSGTFYAPVFDLDNFGGGVGNLNGLHYVSRIVTVGSANAVTLLPGDLLFSTAQNETLGGVAISSDDIALFRPTTPGNYSAGTFSILLQNPMAGNATRDFALVETATVVGGVTLNAGDFLLTASSGTYDKDITRYQVIDVGPGTTSGTRTEFIDGASAGIGFGQQIFGVELVQANATLGGTTLTAGQLLLSLNGNDTVGTNNVSVTANDIFTLTVTSTGTGASSGTVSLFVQGADIGLTAGGDQYDAIALLPLNHAPVLDSSKSPTVTSINEDAGAPVGAVGTLVSALVDFSSPAGQVDNVTDLDVSALLGIAITAADTSNGTWHYSIDGGSNWNTLGAVTGSAARLLAADANSRLYFQPTANYNGTITNGITFRAWDRTSGTNGSTASTIANGESTAFSTATDSASLTINAVNDQPAFSSLNGTPTFTEGGSAVVFDSNVTIFDPELSAANNFSGATLTLVRNGAANAQDVYSATGTLSALTQGGSLVVGGTTVGTVTTNSSGTLVLTFNANATNALVNSVMQQIAYGNRSDVPPASAQINWTFNDNNSGAQGTGGALAATGSTTVTITATNDVPFANNDDGHLDFDGIDDFVSIANSPSLTMSTALTLEAWFKADPSANITQMIFNKEGEYEVAVHSDGSLQWAIAQADNTWTWHNTGYTVTTSVWTHVAVTYDNGMVTTFVNGNVVHSESITGPIGDAYPGLNELRIGGRSNAANAHFDGAIDDVRIWNVTRTQAQIQASMATMLVGNEAGLVGYYQFDELGGTSVNDSSTFNNDGTFGGTSSPTRIQYATGENTSLVVSAADGVLANDTDLDGDSLFVTHLNGSAVAIGVPTVIASGATVTLNANGSFTYNPGTTFDWLTAGVATSDSFSYTISDGNGSSESAQATIVLSGINDEQVVATNTGATFAENSTGNVVSSAMLLTTDVDNSALQLTYTLTGIPANGTLYRNAVALGVSGTFTQADINSGLITYSHNGSETGSDSFAFSVNDLAGASSTGTFNFTISPVNDNTPVITSNGGGLTAAINVAENSTAVTTVTASDGDLPAPTLVYSITGGADMGLFSIDSSTGELTLVSGRNRESHTDADSNGIYEVTVRVSDGTNFDGQDISVTITDVDEFDTGAVTDSNATANSVAENATSGTVVNITALASDADATTNTITYSLQNNDGGRFTIDANTGVVTVNGAINRETDGASRNITVRAISADTSFTDQVFTINIADIDEFDVTAPIDTNAVANAVNENVANGTVVGITANASDSDATTNTVTYSLTDNAGGRFAIDSNTGVVTVADGTLLNREAAASHNITVRATSADASTADTVFTINVNDIDEFDVGAVTDVNAAGNTVAEDAAVGTAVGLTAFASDADATNNAITYTLDDNAGGLFSIDAITGIVTVNAALDYETSTSHNITVRGTSSDGSIATQVFAINVTNVNEAGVSPITDTNAAANTVAENSAVGSAVGVTANATDPDVFEIVSYSLDDTAGGRFAIDPSTGIVTVAGALDREAAGSYSITIRATSSDTSFTTLVLSITISDVDEFDVTPPVDGDIGTNGVDENAVNGTAVGITAVASDADATTNAVTYSLTDNAGGRFAIDANTGVVTVADGSLLDRELAASHNITVRATSADASTADTVFTINVGDVDEFDVTAPVDGNPGTNGIDENAGNGTAVGIAAYASDADATTNTVTYSLIDNAGGRFAIDANTGVVTVADGSLLNRELAASHNIAVRAASADGSTADTVFTINIADIDEFDVTAPVDTNAAANNVDENAFNGTIVGITANASDSDATMNTVTYSLTDSASGRFAIDANTGAVTVADGTLLNRELAASHNITVRATSADGSTADSNYTINISDVNEFDVSAPVDGNPGTNGVDENAVNGTAAGVTAVATDADATTNVVTYSLTDNAGGRFAIDANTGVVTVADGSLLNRELAASHNITVRATSADASTADTVFTIIVGDVDEFDVTAPVDGNPGTNGVDENAGNGTTVGIAAYASDADATTNTVTYSLTDNAGGRFAIDANTGVVTVADGSLLDRELAASHNITVRATSADASTADTVVTINVNDIDEFDVGAVTDVNAAGNTVAEDAAVGTAVGLTAFASDADATNNAITYTLDDNAGGLFSIDAITGIVTVNAALDYETSTSHNITVRGTSSDGSIATQVFAINVTNVNEAGVSPITDTNAAANTVAENSAVGATVGVTANATDADTTDTVAYSLDDTAGGRFAIDSSTGIVTVAGALDREAAGSYSITIRATSSDTSFTTLVLSITISDVDEFDVTPPVDGDIGTNGVDENAVNGTAVGITAVASDADATTNAVTYSLTDNAGGRFAIDANTGVVTVADGSLLDRELAASHNITVRATSADASTADTVFTINVGDVDEFDVTAPVDGNPGTNGIDENAGNGTAVGIAAYASDADATTNTVTYSLTDNAGGRFAIDANTGVVTVADGSLLNRELAASHNIAVRAASADGSTADSIFTISVNDVDEFDVGAVTDVNAAVNSLAEDAAVGTAVGVTAFASDADATNNAMTYTLDDDAGGLFAIDGVTGVVTLNMALDYELASSHILTVRATSVDGSFRSQSFAISVTPVNDNTPSIISNGGGSNAAVSVAENQTTVTTVTATDADLPSQTLTYSIVSGADAGLFMISSTTGELTFSSPPDVETFADSNSDGVYEVVVQVSDGGLVDQQTILVTVTNVNEAPTDIAPNTFGVDENTNTLGGYSLGVMSATDPDAGDAKTFSILAGADSPMFSFGGAGGDELILNDGTLDFERKSSYLVTVRVTDGNGQSYDETITVNVNNLNDSPTAITPIAISLDENIDTTGGWNLGGLLATDQDAGDSFTFTIVGGADATKFSIGWMGGNSLALDDGMLDFERQSSYEVIVRVTDAGGLTHDETIRVSVRDLNEAPTNILPNVFTVAENTDTSAGLSLGQFVATDEDSGDTFTYSIIGGPDAARFTMGGLGGDELIFSAGVLNFEVSSSYSVVVRVTDAGGLSQDTTVVVAVTNVNENPMAASDLFGVAEEQLIGGNVLANDADPENDSLTAQLVSGPSNAGSFSLNADGTFTYTPSANYFGTDSFTYRANDGSLNSALVTVTINVSNVNDSPIGVADRYILPADLHANIVNSVTANDIDVDGPTLVAILVRQPLFGDFQFNSNGTFTYKPFGGFIGTDSFAYRPTDGIATGVEILVQLEVVSAGTQNSQPGVVTPTTVDPTKDLPKVSETTTKSITKSSDSEPATGQLVNILTSSNPINNGISSGTLETDISNQLSAGLRMGDEARAASILDFILSVSQTLNRTIGTEQADALLRNGLSLIFNMQRLSEQLDSLGEGLANEGRGFTTAEMGFAISTVSMTAGYLIWSLRGGMLLATFVTSLPSWQWIDPLPILESYPESSRKQSKEELDRFFHVGRRQN